MNRISVSVVVLAVSGSALLAGAARAAPLDDLARAHYRADWAAGPVAATRLGVHDGDARLDDVSAAAADAQVARLHRERDALRRLDLSGLSQRDRDDAEVLGAQIDRELLQDERIQPAVHDPDFYVSLVTDGAYSLIDRDDAPLPDRLRAVVARERAVPAMLRLARTRLSGIPPVFVDIAREDLRGSYGFIGHDVPSALAGVHDPALQAQLAAATRGALDALHGFDAFLAGCKPTGSFVLGPDIMGGLLAADLVDLPINGVLSAGRAQLAKDKAAFLAAERALDKDHPADSLVLVRHDHPPADQLLDAVAVQLRLLQRFVIAHRIVTLPSTALPTVTLTPPFRRALITAAMDWPGPFETGTRPGALTSFLYVTPPDPSLTPERTEQALADFNRPELEIAVAHEAMPGHFVQGLILRAHPEWSLVRRASQSDTTTEGWAHYAEQMMVDEGFGDGDPRIRLMQLQDALLRDCRLLDAFGLHTGGMTLAKAAALMRTECFQSPDSAAREARRGAEDPGYYAYTLGKLMILHLRDDVQRQEGAAFSLTRFHDALLGAGLVPLRIVRRELTGRDDPLL